MRGNADTFAVCPCHAKLYIMRNDAWAITICGSANLTNNPRIEVSTITEDRQVAGFHVDWIDRVTASSRKWDEILGKHG